MNPPLPPPPPPSFKAIFFKQKKSSMHEFLKHVLSIHMQYEFSYEGKDLKNALNPCKNPVHRFM